MKDFQLRNDTKLIFTKDPIEKIKPYVENKNVLFVYGGDSVKKNSCYDDIKIAVEQAHGQFFELANASRELESIERGIEFAEKNKIDFIIGAGGASVMDCSKLISFGFYHQQDLWDYIKGSKNPYGLEKLPLLLIPTYPSSGSEYGLGAVCVDSRTSQSGTAYGIPADVALLVPEYSMSLDQKMSAYSGLVTFVQLSASVIGDENKVSYDIGVSVLKNVLNATKILKEDPQNEDARGTILYGASLSTSGRLGLGKIENYAYDIYELEFIPEELFQVPYRESLTVLYPRFLKAMSKYYPKAIHQFIKDVFGYDEPIKQATDQIIHLFEDFGCPMYFDKKTTSKMIESISVETIFTQDQVNQIILECLK